MDFSKKKKIDYLTNDIGNNQPSSGYRNTSLDFLLGDNQIHSPLEKMEKPKILRQVENLRDKFVSNLGRWDLPKSRLGRKF